MTPTLTKSQADAVKRGVEWWKNDRHRGKQIYGVFGAAGCGKSYLIKHLIAELGLSDEEVLYVCPTNKATENLIRKGIPNARTLHSLIYKPVEPDQDKIDLAHAEIDAIKREMPHMANQQRAIAARNVAQLEYKLREMHSPYFVLNNESEIRDAKLCVVDECYMVGAEEGRALESFGVPLIVTGDNFQLRPVRQEPHFTERLADVMLTEIMRNTGPIVRLAHMAKDGIEIPFGQHDDEGNVMKLRQGAITPEQMLKADGLIVGYNRTRYNYNNLLKKAAGFTQSWLPVGGEKIMMVKNNRERGIFNGGIVSLSGIKYKNDLEFSAIVTRDDNRVVGRCKIYTGFFADHISLDKNRGVRDYKIAKNLEAATWCWARTAYNYQGDEGTNIIVIDDNFGMTAEDRRRDMYTRLTRARSGLLILA